MLDVVHTGSWERISRMSRGELSLRHGIGLMSQAVRRALQVRAARLKRHRACAGSHVLQSRRASLSLCQHSVG